MPLAAPGATEKVDVGALVTKVDASKQKPTATIAKGKKAGLKVGDTGELYPLHTSEGSTGTSVNFDVRLAVGKVTEVKDDSATLALDAIADTIEVGSYFSYRIAAPVSLAQSPLFRVTALGIELRPQTEVVPYITVEQMLADPTEARINKALDAMIADIKGMKDVITGALKDPIQEGAYHGKTAGQIIDALDRAQITDFLVFVEGFPGRYIAHHWKTPEVYFTWIISGTPSGERSRQVRKASASLTAASEAIRAGKLDEARAHYQVVLKTVPDHKTALDNTKKIDEILLLTRAVTADPDDTASGYTLADELFNLGAYELAMTKIAPLKKRGYDPFKTERLRAYLFVRQNKFKDAEAAFKRLQKDRKDDKNLAEWLAYSRAHAKIAKNAKDPTGYMELAEVHLMNKAWDATLTQYRKVLDLPNATAKQREIAKTAQVRISIQKEVDERLEWARGDIKEHDLKGANDRIAQVIKLLGQLKDDKQAGEILDELANLARSSGRSRRAA
jgi:tetratricopeptide (TPR) repeat protein